LEELQSKFDPLDLPKQPRAFYQLSQHRRKARIVNNNILVQNLRAEIAASAIDPRHDAQRFVIGDVTANDSKNFWW
jgi:hypothetical protein